MCCLPLMGAFHPDENCPPKKRRNSLHSLKCLKTAAENVTTNFEKLAHVIRKLAAFLRPLWESEISKSWVTGWFRNIKSWLPWISVTVMKVMIYKINEINPLLTHTERGFDLRKSLSYGVSFVPVHDHGHFFDISWWRPLPFLNIKKRRGSLKRWRFGNLVSKGHLC